MNERTTSSFCLFDLLFVPRSIFAVSSPLSLISCSLPFGDNAELRSDSGSLKGILSLIVLTPFDLFSSISDSHPCVRSISFQANQWFQIPLMNPIKCNLLWFCCVASWLQASRRGRRGRPPPPLKPYSLHVCDNADAYAKPVHVDNNNQMLHCKVFCYDS